MLITGRHFFHFLKSSKCRESYKEMKINRDTDMWIASLEKKVIAWLDNRKVFNNFPVAFSNESWLISTSCCYWAIK